MSRIRHNTIVQMPAQSTGLGCLFGNDFKTREEMVKPVSNQSVRVITWSPPAPAGLSEVK
jgi:hypothetical protein